MIFSKDEFDLIMADESKKIIDDIIWTSKTDSSPRVTFRAKIYSHDGYPIITDGRYNRITSKLSYSIIHQKIPSRIFGLDMGDDHSNPPDNILVGINHIHHWTEKYRDRLAYSANGIISYSSKNPSGVWKEFCELAKIEFQGIMRDIPPMQLSIDTDLGMIS